MLKLDTKIVIENDKFASATKIKIDFEFNFRNVETRDYRYYYAHENNTLYENLNFTIQKRIWLQSSEKTEKMSNAARNARPQSGYSNWSLTLQFLPLCSKAIQWDDRFCSTWTFTTIFALELTFI